MKRFVIAALLTVAPVPALARGAGPFVLVNGTTAELGQLSIRRAGSQEWRALGNAPGAGARSSMTFSDPDCAFDIQATIPGSGPGSGPVTWAAINLCGAKSVTLQRDSEVGTWVDYDQ